MKQALFATLSLFLLSTSSTFAQDQSPPTFGFVTEDPFVEPGQSVSRNDITFLGGVFVSDTFGGAAEFWNADYLSSTMIGAAVGRDFYDLGAGFILGGVAGAALRFGDDDPTSGELWAGLRLRHQGLLLGNLLISPGVAAGFSAVSKANAIEREREIYYDGDATFLGFIGPEIALRWRTMPKVELITQLHHRSGAAGTFGNMGEGSNAWNVGLRIKF